MTQVRITYILITFALIIGAFTPTRAQKNEAGIKTDTLWGAYCYRETNGNISGVTRRTEPFRHFPLRKGEKMLYYVLADKCTASLRLSFNTRQKAKPIFSLKMTEMNTGKTIVENTIRKTFSDKEEQAIKINNVKLPSKSWYCIELTAQDWDSLSSINHFTFTHNSAIGIKPSPIFMAPSVHLNGWNSTDPNAPKGEAYDWAYMEVMLPKKYEIKNTYVMSLGVLSGYMGIQTIDDEGNQEYKHRVLFSMWDKGDTDADANLPDYLRSGALDHADGVKINRFGGEGTGTQSIIYDSHWECDNWVQFLTTCRPERLDITIKGCAGQDSVIEYTNTLVSAWYKEANESEWHYLSTLREAGRNHYMSGWYSFLENFTDDGGNRYRRAYYRNGFFHSLTDNKWYHRNKVGFGHTQGSDKQPRYDYGHGVTNIYPNCFYLEQGGYTLTANDSADVLPLATAYTPVDTINLSALWGRMEQAIRNENSGHMNELIAQAAEQTDKLAAFKALSKEYLDNADKFGYYSSADLCDLEAVYDNGQTTDAAGLAVCLRELAITANPLKCGKAIRPEHIGVAHGYQIHLADGSALIAKDNGIGYASDIIATDHAYNWRFIRQGLTNKYYIFNLQAEKYLNPDSENMLSAIPVEVSLTAKDKDGTFVIGEGNKKIECQIIDNYYVEHLK